MSDSDDAFSDNEEVSRLILFRNKRLCCERCIIYKVSSEQHFLYVVRGPQWTNFSFVLLASGRGVGGGEVA